ncbi:glycosyl transferase, group 1 [Sulfuriferula multivorans]|uniref:Glycosyl transferase, group 1 n=1 Tax=Sulfuriferula multivorans TaxID=1559896 RepID=A0A401J9B5_9PROT|nr:glycosyltransferase [Sulfuriferula multivorans]GBL44262.1 glycosyl transferase, group 1 [Sulfuriferula multivorans]
MRIVFIITGLSTGGAEMMLLKVLERLDRQRFAPHVISLTTLGELAPRIAALGIPVDAIGMKSGLPSPSGFFRLVQLLKRLNPDVVHTWMYHADLLGGLAARLAGVSAVGWCIRNSNLDKDKTKFSTRAVVSLCASMSKWVPSRILSCSEKARQVHVRYGYAAEKMVVVPNGFDLTRFKPDGHARSMIRTELGIEVDTPLVGLIGRFDPQKNHAGFFEAAGTLHRRMPQVHFVLAGQDIDMSNAALMQAITQEGVLSNTHLLGLRNDIPALMAALDVLASSSYGEAFPNVLGEAMACGVPCVVTDVGDSAYIVGDTGRVVASSDMTGLAAALEELLVLPPSEKAALGERARARVAAHFEIGKVVQQYEDFYETVLAHIR